MTVSIALSYYTKGYRAVCGSVYSGGGGVMRSHVKLSHMRSCPFLNINAGQSGLGGLGAVGLIALMSIFIYFLILVKLCSIFMLIMWPILRVIRWARHS